MSKRIQYTGRTSPHSISVPDVIHAQVESASQATGLSTSSLYALGGELVARLLAYGGQAGQQAELARLGAFLADVGGDRAAVWWALEQLKNGTNNPL